MSMDTISDKDLIDKFLKGELLENELSLFNARKKDEAFLVLLEEAVIAYKGRLALKEKLKTIGEELKTEKSSSHKKPLFWISAIAATILLIIAFQFFSNQAISSGELFDTYFEAYPNAHTIKGSSDTTAIKKAFEHYDAEAYKQAANAFKKIATTRALNSSEHFYYGISSLAISDVKNAKIHFREVSKEHPLFHEAQWYTSLALIKQDSLQKAKTLLNDNKLNFSTYRNDKVKKLLNQIK